MIEDLSSPSIQPGSYQITFTLTDGIIFGETVYVIDIDVIGNLENLEDIIEILEEVVEEETNDE